MARVCRIPSAIVGQLEEHEGDRELEREMRDAGVDLEAEAEGAGARAPAVRAPTERVDREALRRDAGVSAPTARGKSPVRRRQPEHGALPPGWRAETRSAGDWEHVVYHGPNGQLAASRQGMALALEEEGATASAVPAEVTDLAEHAVEASRPSTRKAPTQRSRS